jgi:hypothetical protein
MTAFSISPVLFFRLVPGYVNKKHPALGPDAFTNVIFDD